MAYVTGIRNLQGVGLTWRDEAEGVAADIHIRDRLLDFRHMTGEAIVAGAARLMVRVRLD